MIGRRNALIVSDDIPWAFVTEMLFNRGRTDRVFSIRDAVLAAEARNLRSPHPQRLFKHLTTAIPKSHGDR
jgi:hypothetical protein